MDPQREIERMLEEHGAILVRQGRHLVYKLPNGQTFVQPKTPGDANRGARNSLSDLRHALGIVRAAAKEKEAVMPIGSTPAPQPTPAAAPIPEQQPSPSLKDRLEAAIAAEEARQEKLMAEAQQVERCVQMLRAVLPFTDDPAAEDTLRRILPAPQASPPPPQAAPAAAQPTAPPQVITDRVQVTRQLVLAATQTFEDTFTVNDVLALMTGARHIDPPERLRVRSSIAQCMMSLLDRGELIRVAEGGGKRQAIWRKATLTSSGIRA